jgi:two-component system, chemotaxis family, sensor kinase CheA
MDQKQQEFQKKLLAMFKVEAQEHLQALASGLIDLEQTQDASQQLALIEKAFREAHSLKGAARAVGLSGLETVCQFLEGRFSALKRREIRPSPELLDELHRAVNQLSALLHSAAGEDAADKVGQADGSPHRGTEETTGISAQSAKSESGVDSETVRIGTAKLDALFLQAEELLLAKLAAARQAEDLRGTAAALAEWRRTGDELRPHLRGLEKSGKGANFGHGDSKAAAHLERILQYLEWEGTFARTLESRLSEQAYAADQHARFLAGKVDGLIEDAKRILMLPASAVLDLFPKLVHDLSREQGKELDFVMQGTEVEVDKRILEEMKVPLIHLLRNAIDHAIEKPEVRIEKKKSARGRLSLGVAQRGGRIEILVTDDGAGINLERLAEAAVRTGALSPTESEKLDPKGTLSLIFRSGVSTSPVVTKISGRGLGLAIVREKVEKLGGSVSVESHRDAGTSFRISLPVTLATFRGILVRVKDQVFVLPDLGVERVARAGPDDVQSVENRETIEIGGLAVSLVRLGEVLGLPGAAPAPDKNRKEPAVVLSRQEAVMACVVDEILGEQEVLVKNISKPFSSVPYMSGATVLTTGQVAPILSVEHLFESAAKSSQPPAATFGTQAKPPKPKTILVAEDSITARSLLKGILESAGFAVQTAVDGADAFTALKTGAFDLVVSDVDMPRMSGFDLTAKIRADKGLAQLPVVLVTALESREDRERGIDVGADAYIVKSSFDQSNLLEVIQRLV